jgi:tetratricopeptide (TPR) repeat protein
MTTLGNPGATTQAWSASALGRACSSLMAFALAMGHASPARCDEPTPTATASDEAAVEQRRSEARAKYEAGADAYERKHYKDAVDFFLAADRLAPSAPLSFNIARAYERLGDDASALRWYRDYLRRNPTAPNANAVRELVTKFANVLRQKGIQQVSVASTPAGATVSIDDQPLGVTPWTGELAPGKHRILLTLRGYADAERDFDLGANEPLDVAIRLEQPAAAPPTSSPAPAIANPSPPASALPAPSPPEQRPIAATQGKRLGAWPWVTLGAGAVALGGSLGFELLRRSSESDAKQQSTQLGFQNSLDRMDSRKTDARILLGVGGALVLAGGVLLWVDRGSAQPRTGLGLACVPGACAFAGRSEF